MSTLRSEGWTVRPPFVPGGPTTNVSLWSDEAGLTQIAGDPPVAWQTPWLEIDAVQLVRSGRSMALFATIDSVRYCWRSTSNADYEEWRAIVLAHGGSITRPQRRSGVLAVVVIVLLASFGGAIAAWFNRGATTASALSDARAVNLTQKDLGNSWYVATSPILAALVAPSTQVIVATPTTVAPKANSVYAKAAALFQNCLGVTNAKDRMYGAAGQQPSYQVSSNVYATTDFGGTEVATTSQYYATTAMVLRDEREMKKSNFGACFAKASGAIVLSGFGLKPRANTVAVNWSPSTLLHGFSRGGVVNLAVPGVRTHLQLVMAVVVSGHYEVTLSAVTNEWPSTKGFFNALVTTLLSRVSSTSARAA